MSLSYKRILLEGCWNQEYRGIEEDWSIQATGGEGQSQAHEQLEPEMREVAGLLHLSPNANFPPLFCRGLACVQNGKCG